MATTKDQPVAVAVVSDPKLRKALRRAASASGSELRFCQDALEFEGRGSAIMFVESKTVSASQLRDMCQTVGPDSQVMVFGDSPADANSLENLRLSTLNHIVFDMDLVDETQLVVTLVKLLSGDHFGIEKYVPPGAAVTEFEVATYEEKNRVLAGLEETMRGFGVRRAVAMRIESAADELLMNAIYDAPRGANQEEAELVRPAVLRTASDGRFFVLSVTDPYGTLEKQVVLEKLTEARKRGGAPLMTGGSSKAGAGLGLHVVLTSCSCFVANIESGKRTEVICLFDLRREPSELGRYAGSLHFFAG